MPQMDTTTAPAAAPAAPAAGTTAAHSLIDARLSKIEDAALRIKKLMAEDGLYARLYRMQFRPFNPNAPEWPSTGREASRPADAI